MSKVAFVVGCLFGGLFLIALGLFGMTAVWNRIWFMSLAPLQSSWQTGVGLIVGGFFLLFVGGIAMKTK